MHYDEDLAIEIGNRINEIFRTLPPGTQPFTIMTGIVAPLAKLLRHLREEDRQPAFDYIVGQLRENGGFTKAN